MALLTTFAAFLTTCGLAGTAWLTWFFIRLGGICIDGVQSNCNSSVRPTAAALAVAAGAVVALVLVVRRSRLAPTALVAAFAWNVLMQATMDAINLSEFGSQDLWLSRLALLLPFNLIMLAPTLFFLIGAAAVAPLRSSAPSSAV